MNKVLKWILYIILGLVVLSIVAGVLFMIFSGFRYGMMGPGIRSFGPGIRMMEPRSFYFHGGPSIFGGLLCLGVLLLVIVGVVALVNALTQKNTPSQITQPAQVATPPEVVVAQSQTCSNCGKSTQADWKTCPYCGNPLVE